MRCGLAILVGSLVAGAGLLGQGLAEPLGLSREGGALVPHEEYPVFDRIVESKFLTLQTRLVVIERTTVSTVHPEVPVPPNDGWFAATRPFDGRLPSDLIRDFVAKNQSNARLEQRFGFGVTVRFVTADGLAEPEIRFVPSRHEAASYLVAEPWIDARSTIDRLGFSRAGFTHREDQALVYVANERPDGSGAGLLVWLAREAGAWTVVETEILWVARQAGEEPLTREHDRS